MVERITIHNVLTFFESIESAKIISRRYIGGRFSSERSSLTKILRLIAKASVKLLSGEDTTLALSDFRAEGLNKTGNTVRQLALLLEAIGLAREIYEVREGARTLYYVKSAYPDGIKGVDIKKYSENFDNETAGAIIIRALLLGNKVLARFIAELARGSLPKPDSQELSQLPQYYSVYAALVPSIQWHCMFLPCIHESPYSENVLQTLKKNRVNKHGVVIIPYALSDLALLPFAAALAGLIVIKDEGPAMIRVDELSRGYIHYLEAVWDTDIRHVAELLENVLTSIIKGRNYVQILLEDEAEAIRATGELAKELVTR